MKETLHYGIIGGGKVARHIMHYFSLLGIQFTNWSRSDQISVQEKLIAADIVMILINESNIESFYQNNLFLKDKICVHFSGALNVDGIIGVHPLMTFGLDFYSIDTYRKIPFVVEKSNFKFVDLFPDLENPSYEIDKNKKSLYHAKCVMASNFMVIFLNSYFEYMQKEIGVKNDDAALLIETTLENVLATGREALTGPLSRKDLITIRKNISSLRSSGEDRLYTEFINAYFPQIKDELCLQ